MKHQEKFIVSFLNVKNKLLGYKVISQGSLDAVSVDIKEAMKWAIRCKAHGLIILHNHPSGSPNHRMRISTLRGALRKRLNDGNGIAGSCHHRGWHLCESQ